MAIPPIGSLGSLGKLAGAPSINSPAESSKSGEGFGQKITNALDNLQATQDNRRPQDPW